ncbi:MAG TPA: VOC family protein [Streptosporangiaceae bacterium]|jgi:catechol 2,3-dioxygenase-like lactoylglutathione lyase family enzyme
MTQGNGFKIDGLHHVQLAIPAGGEDAARQFWGQTLGLTELTKPAGLAGRGGCWFGGGTLELHLGVEENFAPARKAHPGILVSGLAGLAARLEAAGASVTWDTELSGHDRFYSDDPFGNRLEFLAPKQNS